jgi:DHA2 family multidrug resistance protein
MMRTLGGHLTIAIGMVLFGSGIYTMGWLTWDSGFWDMAWPQGLRGFGVMLCMITTNAFALSIIPMQEIKVASGVFSLMRNLGGAFGLAVLNTLMIERNDLHISRLGEWVSTARLPAVDMLEGMQAQVGDLHGGTMDAARAGLQMVYGLVQREAMVLTFGDLTLLMSAMFVFTICLVPFMAPLPAMPAMPKADAEPARPAAPSPAASPANAPGPPVAAGPVAARAAAG